MNLVSSEMTLVTAVTNIKLCFKEYCPNLFHNNSIGMMYAIVVAIGPHSNLNQSQRRTR